MDLNRVTLVGNLTCDPEAKTFASDKKLMVLKVATNYYVKDKSKDKGVEYHDVLVFGKLGDFVAKYLKKGGKVFLEGRLSTRDWVDKKEVTHHQTSIIASNIIILDKVNKNIEEGSDSKTGTDDNDDMEEIDF